MATQFSDLQKLLINVAAGKCDAFINAHVNNTWPVGDNVERPSELPEFTAGENDTYFNKVVFLQKYNAIYTKGTFFGYNGDLNASFDDLFTNLQTGISSNGITVKFDPVGNDEHGPAIVTTVEAATYDKDSDTWDDIDNVVTGETVKTYVDEKFADAIAEATAAMNFKGPIDDAVEFASTLAKANNGDVYVVANPGFTGGNGEIFEPGDLIIFWKENDLAPTTYTVVEKNLDNAVEKHADWKGEVVGEKIVVASGLNNVKPTNYTTGGASFSATESGEYILATEAAVDEAIRNAIDAIDETDGKGEGDYMTYTFSTINGITHVDSINPIIATTAIADGVLGGLSYGLVNHDTLETVISYFKGRLDDIDYDITTIDLVTDNDYYSIVDRGKEGDSDRTYKIDLNVVSLSDVVGMTYNEETGKWVAPEGSLVTDGLASAADVANELVNDEKVIAAALNDHEARIDTLESFSNDINGTIQEQLVIGEVTVNGLTATKAKDGLVNADLLVSVINALDPWQEYE